MKIIRSLEQLHTFTEPCVIALGTFDGLHLGHKDVIGSAKEYASQHGEKLAVFTFSNHPLSLIKPELVPVALLTQEQKHACFEAMGVDLLLDIPFDEALANLAPEEFLQKLSILNFSCLVVGENFSFGKKGAGNIQTLTAFTQEHNCKLIVRPLVSDNQTVISSTAIRHLIAAGEVAKARYMLGRAYTLSGTVVYGNQRGNKIGFPTANLALEAAKIAVPKGGVYAVKVYFDGKCYEGMGNIGKNPTFGDVEEARLEVNIFDFDGNLYGKEITVAFCERIRGEVKFTSVDELVEQIKKDKEVVLNCLRNC
ncbi:MAG: bifunctional riboflavin kinase/FAD synthetase [Phascolarctobacterium sp.]|nr:bifunctional riboflavin kinase/FAD synthetase [Phascolarctobacterium sp.]